jgi:hypothetical protein
MVRTRSHTRSSVESWTLIGTLKEVRIPARPRSSGNASHEVTRFSHVGYRTQALTPPESPTRASSFLTTSNAPSQLYVLTKVLDTVRLYLHLYAPECLPILHELRSMMDDFITNYGVDGWSPTRPRVRIDRGVVSRVLDHVHRAAHAMLGWDSDIEVLEHAARRAVDMFKKGTLNVKGWEREGVSEIHLGMWEFVKWMEQEC